MLIKRSQEEKRFLVIIKSFAFVDTKTLVFNFLEDRLRATTRDLKQLMESRGQKRQEMGDELPADKRACSSFDFRPSSSTASVQTDLNPTPSEAEPHGNDMDTSSSASASSQSEGEPEKDSAYGSCDSDDMEHNHSSLQEYHRRRLASDHGKFKNIISSLSGQTEPSGQFAVLTELCEVLSFCTEGSLSSMTSDLLSPLLVKLANRESNPDIMMLSIRAITHICDLYPQSAGFLVRQMLFLLYVKNY